MAALFKVTHTPKGTDQIKTYNVYAVHYGGPYRAELFIWDPELGKFRFIESGTCKLMFAK